MSTAEARAIAASMIASGRAHLPIRVADAYTKKRRAQWRDSATRGHMLRPTAIRFGNYGNKWPASKRREYNRAYRAAHMRIQRAYPNAMPAMRATMRLALLGWFECGAGI